MNVVYSGSSLASASLAQIQMGLAPLLDPIPEEEPELLPGRLLLARWSEDRVW